MMDERIRREAVAAAQQLLQNFREAHPTWTDDRTPIDTLVSWCGLEVATFHPDDQPQGTYGWLEPGEDLIWLCRNLTETLRRFTLAHELGHAILHRHTTAHDQHTPGPSHDDLCQEIDIQEELTGLLDQEQIEEILGIGQSYDPRSQRELAANLFAAELLMPLEQVRTHYLTQQTLPHQLATSFGVSTAAILNRLVSLITNPLGPGGAGVEGLESGGPAVALGGNIEHAKSVSAAAGAQGPGATAGPPPFPTPPPPLRDQVSAKKYYDEFQQAAIEAPTPALIVAGPGSGKTSTLIGRAEYLIRVLGVQPQQMLALTFSRKAAQEMRERLQQALSGTRTPSQGGLPTVSTFHAFCAELLRTHGALVGLRQDFSFVDDAEGYFLLRQLAGTLPLRHYQHLTLPALYFPDLLQAISRAKDELVTPEQYQHLAQQMLEQAQNDEEAQKAEKALEVAAIYARYQEGLQKRGDTDFGGLIMLTVQLLQQHPEVLQEQQQRYQHILVDEFQDMNRASGVLLRLLAGEACRVWVVGDANQAIYSFRGASPANIANFQHEYPGATILPLSRNYRSRPDIVSVADAFRLRQLVTYPPPSNAMSASLRHTLPSPPDRMPHTEQGARQTARPSHPTAYVTQAVAVDEASELAGLVADVRYKLAHEGYSYRDLVVLCRTRAQARKITHALALAGLPVIERGSMLEQQHIRDVLSIVLLLAEPSGMGILRAARQPEHAFSQNDIETVLLAAREQHCTAGALIARGEAPPDISPEGRRSLQRLADILQALSRSPNVWSMLAQYLFIETSIVRNLLCATDRTQARQVLADYAALLQLARHYDQRKQREAEQEGHIVHITVSPSQMQEQARGFIDHLSVLLTLRQDGGQRQQGTEEGDEASADVICVMTVHASKGLEFPVVYLPGLLQRRFPMQARYSPITPPAGMLAAGGEARAVGEVHETGEACLFYVGVTRARDHLILSYSERYGKQKYKPSLYLDALVTGLPPERLTTLRWEDPALGTDLTPPVGARGVGAGDEATSSQPSEHFIAAMQPTTLRVSAIETYQTCPRRYAYSNIYSFRREESAYQLFWQATQKTLEALQLAHAEKKGGIGDQEGRSPFMTREEAQDLYTQHWQAVGGHEYAFAPVYEQHGREIVERVWSLLAADQDMAWELRRGFEVDVAGTTIRVEVDRVEASAQAGSKPVKFVRTRVGKSKEKPTAEVRELLYAHAYRQQHPGQGIEVHQHNLSSGEIVPIKITEKREQRLYDELEQTIRGLDSHNYPATPDSFICPTCPFFLICPA